MYCTRTICFRIRVIKFEFWVTSMILQPLPNFKTQFSPKDEVGSYDNNALNQRDMRVSILLGVSRIFFMGI